MANGGLFVGLTILVLIVVIVLHYKVPRELKGFHIALAFFIGGTLGNFIDRVRTGYVVDFLDPNLWSIFNVADCFITISVVVICCMLLFGRLGKLLDKDNRSNTHEYKKIEITIDQDGQDQRLDIYLATLYPEFTRSRLQNMIRDGQITVNGGHVKTGYKLQAHDHVLLQIVGSRSRTF